MAYYEVPILPHAGFGMWEAQPITGDAWTDEDDLIQEIAENVVHMIELGQEPLPAGVADIRGRIYNEPERVFAVKSDGQEWDYIGITAMEDTD